MSKKIKRLYLFLTLKLLFPWQYRRFRKLPLKKWKAVFIEANLTQLSGSLRFLYQVLCSEEEMEVSVHYLMESGNKWKFIQNAMACLKDWLLLSASCIIKVKSTEFRKVYRLWAS